MRVLALAGGVGGGRLADGLYRVLPADSLTVVVNTGDDFWLHGLRICPDLDTVMYTLSGLGDAAQGWGLQGETYHCQEALGRLGGETWFKLGDRDLATHLVRTQRLARQESLEAVTDHLCRCLGVRARLLPMCEQEVATRVLLQDGQEISFQDYFVRRRHADPVRALRFEGIEKAQPPALPQADLTVLCPSNPFVSLQPILSVPGLVERLGPAPRVAVSPILAGQAVKGPAAQMLASLGHEVSALGVARLYQGLVQVFVLDEADQALVPQIEALGMRAVVLPTLMRDPDDRARLARALLEAVGP